MSELIEMFQKHNINITKEELEPFFKRGNYNITLSGLDLEEFK